MSVPEHAVHEVLNPGVCLREAREQAGLSLEQIAQRTMIPISRLRALEKDEYARVGGATFITGYTRTYARALGVDPEPLVKALQSLLPDLPASPQEPPSIALALQVQKRPKSVFWPVMLVLVVLLGIVAFIGITSTALVDNEPTPEVIPDTPVTDEPNEFGNRANIPLSLGNEEPAGDEGISADATAPDAVVPESDRGVGTDSGRAILESLSDSDFAASGPSSSMPAEVLPRPQIQSEVPIDADTGTEAGITRSQTDIAPASANPPSQLNLSFSAECWVDVTDATGKRIVARLASSGDNLRLFGQPPFDVTLGNAPAVTMTLDGEPVATTPPGGRKMLRLTVGP